jgi:oligogalacturonide lyase
MTISPLKRYLFFMCALLVTGNVLQAQKVLETGGQKMPDTWIDKDTRHLVKRLVPGGGKHASFYFHNNPFVDDDMVYYGNDAQGQRQLYIIALKTGKVTALTNRSTPIKGEIVSAKLRTVFYQCHDSVFATHIDTRKERLVVVFPPDFKGDITTVNADGTLLGGAWATAAEKEISRQNPEKRDFFNKIFKARLPRTLFTIDVNTGELQKIFTDSAWLNHVQFSPTDPKLLMFCHEGQWHEVDRIWTIDVTSKEVKLVHKRTMDREIAGHEWFSPDGRTIWYDLQLPRGETFYVGGTDIASGKERKYRLERNEWSVHYNTAKDQQLFAGDGGSSGSVAKSPDGQWIYLFTPDGDRFKSERLVNMKHHHYKLEPNVHFSPDGKWIIFRANFEGQDDIYAVEITPSGK